jgi:hypothetical protein
METPEKNHVAFVGTNRIAFGSLEQVAGQAKQHHDSGTLERIACFEDATGYPVDLDLSGSAADVVQRIRQQQRSVAEPSPRRGRGRPKLGVVSREVSLLPRHWTWLGQQRGGASAALRRLVEAARKQSAPDDRIQQALDAAHRFLWDMAGNQPCFEEATRALFAKDFPTLRRYTKQWPEGVTTQLDRFVARAESDKSLSD